MSEARTASLERQTSESKVSISVNLDGTGRAQISTGVGFFDHMLTAFAKHSLIDLEVESAGDWHIARRQALAGARFSRPRPGAA